VVAAVSEPVQAECDWRVCRPCGGDVSRHVSPLGLFALLHPHSSAKRPAIDGDQLHNRTTSTAATVSCWNIPSGNTCIHHIHTDSSRCKTCQPNHSGKQTSHQRGSPALVTLAREEAHAWHILLQGHNTCSTTSALCCQATHTLQGEGVDHCKDSPIRACCLHWGRSFRCHP
jgi:hypothetical protein